MNNVNSRKCVSKCATSRSSSVWNSSVSYRCNSSA